MSEFVVPESKPFANCGNNTNCNYNKQHHGLLLFLYIFETKLTYKLHEYEVYYV